MARPLWAAFAAALLAAVAGSSAAARDRWEPVPPDELAALAPATGEEANAAVLLSRVEMRYNAGGSVKDCYRRMKVYSPRGVQTTQRLGIEYPENVTISRLAARVVHRDGRIQEFSERDFQQTTVKKFGEASWRSRRLVVGFVQPGDVVEYRWREAWDGWLPYLTLNCQEEIPVRRFELAVSTSEMSLNVIRYNLPKPAAETRAQDQLRLTLANLPAFRAEPDMPPELNVRGVVIITFSGANRTQREGWQYHAGGLSRLAHSFGQPDDAVAFQAQRLAAGIPSSDERLRRFYDFCQTQIVNTDLEPAAESPAERRRTREPREAGEVLRRGRGSTVEINSLFAALARAAGFDSRLVAAAGRDLVLSPHITNGWNFVAPRFAAIRDGSSFRFFSPGDRFVPFGQLRWQDEGAEVMLSDQERVVWARTPHLPAAASQTRREAELALTADGALEGTVTITLTGHDAVRWRTAAARQSSEDRLRAVREPVTAQLPNAEVTDVTFSGLFDPGQPLAIRYRLRIADYSPPTGDRLVVVPNVFEAGAPPRFDQPRRTYPVVFPYSRQVRDRIALTLPAGSRLEEIDPPKGVGNPDRWIYHSVGYEYEPARRLLVCEREQKVGSGGLVRVAPDRYPQLKSIFETINRGATHAVVVRLGPAP